MLYKLLSVCMLICLIVGCTTQSTDDGSDSIFPLPPVESEETTVPSEPVIIQPVPVPEPQPIIDEPEPVEPHGGARDLVAPKLLNSSIESGAIDVDVDINAVTLTFDETVAKSDIKITDRHNQSLRWKRIVHDKDVILTPLEGARALKLDEQYSVIGIVEDAAGNERVILITFTTGVREPEDNVSPRLVDTTVSHGDKHVNPDTDHFVFTFDEEIGDVEISIINERSRIDLEWTHLIRGEEVVLHKLDQGKNLVAERTYVINITWADKAGNWDRGGIIRFTTEIKE